MVTRELLVTSKQGYSFSVGMLLCVWEYLLNNYLDIGQLKSDGFFLLLVRFGGD